MIERKIRILEVLRVVNPIAMFGIILFGAGYVLDVPLVLAVSLACLSSVIAFTVISIILSSLRKKQ